LRLNPIHGKFALYPEGQFGFSSEGSVVTAECFTYDHEAEALQNTMSDLVDCPGGLMRNVESSAHALCVLPCPSSMFTTEEYSTMHLAFTIPGFAAFFVNACLVLTKLLSSVSFVKTGSGSISMPFGVAWSASMCGLWCFMDIFPAVAMGNDLACPCDNETCYRESTLCAVSSASVFVLQSMYIGNVCTCYELYFKFSNLSRANETISSKYFLCFCLAPVLLFFVALFLGTDELDSPNYSFNHHRSSFKCKCFLNLPDMTTEYIINFSVFMVCALASAVLLFLAAWRIMSVNVNIGASDSSSRFVRIFFVD
jgi:hypothetical protein